MVTVDEERQVRMLALYKQTSRLNNIEPALIYNH
jgi:hypothetical protein